MSKKRKPFLFIVVLFATMLPLLSFWVIRKNSDKLGESFMIHNVEVGYDLSDGLRLTGTISRFPYGARQMYLRFDYSKAAPDSKVRILWLFGEKLVQSDSYELLTPSGAKIYCLVRENGQPLPKGAYSIAILYQEERIQDFRFEIY